MNDYITALDLAKQFKVCRKTIYNWQRSGNFPVACNKIGGKTLFLVKDIEDWIKEKTIYPKGREGDNNGN